MASDPTPAAAIVILAGGRSSRMGASKLLLPLGDAAVIIHVARAAVASSFRPIVLVLGHHAERIRAAVATPDITFVENPAYRDGQSTSLHAGIAALPPSAAGAVVMLGDQPLVTAVELERLVTAARASGAQIAAARYGGVRGNPVYFARSCFPELLAVTGDEGGRGVIARHADAVAWVEMTDPDAALDMDTPDDYARVQRSWASRHPTE